MRVFADFHIHGRFSRATSKDLTLEKLESFARIKGLNLLGTGDLTHPKWFSEIKEELTDDGSGILRSKSGFRFLLQTELSLIYKQGDKIRKIHLVILAPNIGVVEQINSLLLKFGRLDYDGRPTFGVKAFELVELLKSISKDIEVIPAHIWTPWFSLFGSNSGFDSVEECFKDQTKHIFALETGLSSDPEMNWMLSQLDNFTLVSNSDSHSYWPHRIGRECNVFDLKEDFTYKDIINTIRTRENFLFTVEVDPSYGKYHFDGHRNCNVVLSPQESIKLNNTCPVCHKQLTIGVLHRVLELADRPFGFRPKNALPFKRLLPLQELISHYYHVGVLTKKVWSVYNTLIKHFGNEFNVLLDAPPDEIKKFVDENLANIIIKNRQGNIFVRPGFDGVYGVPVFDKDREQEVFSPIDKDVVKNNNQQKSLFDF